MTEAEGDREVLANFIWLKVRNMIEARGGFDHRLDFDKELDIDAVLLIDKTIDNFEKGIFT